MMLESEEVWGLATREWLRALRGHRSQVQFSRWLGYRSNVAADWEGGHRCPTASVLWRAMTRVGIDVQAGFHAFHSDTAAEFERGLPHWLSAQRGRATMVQVAARGGLSRHQVRRWLSGEAEPRVPELLRLVHALTGRGPEWVSCFVEIDAVPSLAPAWRSARAAARLAFDVPWSAAVRVVIGTDAYRAAPTNAWLAESLGVSPEVLDEAIEGLLAAGLAERRGGELVPRSTFTSNAMASADDRRRLKAHWARVASERAALGLEGDLTSLNLITLSEADLARVHELQRDYFRALRSMVAASKPEEAAALVLMQVLRLA